jgi:hypothetical protein
MPEAGRLFERLCAEWGVSVPTHDAAIVQLIRHYAEAIASGVLEPWKGLCRLMNEVYWPHVSEEPTKEYVGDSRGLEQLIGDYYYFDDLIEDWELRKNASAFAKKVSEWEESVRQHAREWLERHPGS